MLVFHRKKKILSDSVSVTNRKMITKKLSMSQGRKSVEGGIHVAGSVMLSQAIQESHKQLDGINLKRPRYFGDVLLSHFCHDFIIMAMTSQWKVVGHIAVYV